jgi:periplasmic divalent cation tolerance protein
MCEAIVVMVTCANDEEADAIADRVVAERLAACAGVAGHVRSLFHWQGALSRATETLLLLKTRAELFDRLSRRVRELHSYEVPEIIALPVVAGDADYLAWVRESTAEAG